MDSTAQPASAIQNEDPWVIARDQYLADLSEEERKLFTHATMENLLLESTEAQNSHEQSSQSRAFMRRLKPFLSAIEDYGSALDVYSNIYPLALAPIWGTLRVILHIARKFNKIFDRIIDVFERIGYVLPRFRDYERIFGKHPRIIKALSAAYLDIITLCSEIKAFIRSIEKARMKSFTKLFSPLDHHLSDAVGRFRLHREDVEMEAEACHMIESAKHYDLELRDRELAAIERKSQLRKHLLHLLSPIDSSAKQRKVLRMRQLGTGDWLTENEEFAAWKNSKQSAILSIFGIPGSGKTIISSYIIDYLQGSMSERVIVIHHFCDYKDPRSLSPMTVAGTLISGLLESIEITDDISSLITYAYQDGQRSPDENSIRQILDVVLDLRLDHVIYVVLDGVDEIQEHDRKMLFGFMKYLMECKHSLLKLVITARADVAKMVCQPRTEMYRLPITQNIISGDIDIFVRHAVRSLISSQELMVREASLEDEIIEKLANGAKGMFLWVTFQLGSLCDCDSDSDIRRTLSNLPRDLTETYERLLNKIQTPQRQNLVRKMLQWIVCARRLLHIDELLEAVAFTIEDEHWDSAKIPADSTRLIRASGNLIVVDDDDHSVHLAHYTVQQFLLTPTIDTGFSFHFTREEADRYLGETCIIYLSFNDFETQITKYTNRTKAHMAVIEKALLQSESIASGGLVESTVIALSKLLRPTIVYKPSKIDYSRHVPQSKHGLQTKYELLGYVVTEWLKHTSKIHPRSSGTKSHNTHAPEIWSRFQKLVFKKQLLFNLRPWDDIKVKDPNLPYIHLVCWAVRNSHLALLKSLDESTPHSLQQYFKSAAEWFGSKNQSYSSTNDCSQSQKIVDMSSILLPDLHQMAETPDPSALFYFIYECCTQGSSEVIELYLSELNRISDAEECRSFTQLNYEYLMIEAAVHGQEEVCTTLLPHCKFNAHIIVQGRPCGALKAAAFQGNTAVVSILQTCPAALFVVTDNEQRVPGQWRDYEAKMIIDAARTGDLNIVNTLLSVCNSMVDASHYDKTELSDLSNIIVGERALMQAVNSGHKDVVMHLLDRGVSVNNPLPWRIFDIDHDLSQGSPLEFAKKVEMGCFALHLAIANNDNSMTNLLLEADADPDLCVYFFQKERYVNRKWKSPLAHAAYLGNLEITRDLIEHGANVESQYLSDTSLESLRFRYTTPLILAAGSGHVQILEYLLESGADVDNYDFAGFTPLAAAAGGDHMPCAQKLLENGASLSLLEHDRVLIASPAIEAIRCGSKAMLTLLLEAGIDLNATSQRKMPLIVAQGEGFTDIVELLIIHGAEVDGDRVARQTIGWPASPLCRAIKSDQGDIVNLLIREGADIYASVGWGRSKTTPFHTAKAHSDLAAARILLNHCYVLNPERCEDFSYEHGEAATHADIQREEPARDQVSDTEGSVRQTEEEYHKGPENGEAFELDHSPPTINEETTPNNYPSKAGDTHEGASMQVEDDPREEETCFAGESLSATNQSQASTSSEYEFSEGSEEDHLGDSVFYRAPG